MKSWILDGRRVILTCKRFRGIVNHFYGDWISLSWLAMNAWLGGFSYSVTIGADVFIIAAVAMTILTFITVNYQSLLAALKNPVKSLKAE